MRDASTTIRPPRGFTLIELLVVITIIGILVAFILVAAQDGIRRAQEKATQSLIAKLESGVAERLEAILLRRADITVGHYAVGAVSNTTVPFPPIVAGDPNFILVNALNTLSYLSTNRTIISPSRAQIIAQYDLVRAELPDVFFVQGAPYGMGAAPYQGQYPMNFAGSDYPPASGNFLVPIGAASTGTAPGQPANFTLTSTDPNKAVGIFGASFQAAGGIYKNLGYLPQGYDGTDNDGDQFVDDLKEGIGTDPLVADPDDPKSQINVSALIQRRLGNHKHITARSETLYAMLVEGGGPLGSVFNRDDFTNREVQDTDGDGLPEFVDAWGQP
ncbi:MAG TPA: type II secretion system protein, partial [Isosphaeraceae bacterium]